MPLRVLTSITNHSIIKPPNKSNPVLAYIINTIAGNGTYGYSGDGGVPTDASLNFPNSVYVDSTGNVFIADSSNHRIRFISKSGGTYYGVPTTAGYIHTIAGNGNNAYNGDDIAPTNATFNMPYGVYEDSSGNLFISEYGNNRIRFFSNTGGTYYGVSTTAGRIYTIAGTGRTTYNGDNIPATNASIANPYCLFVDSIGNVFIVDYGACRIRFISKYGGTYYGVSTTAGYIHTIAGKGTYGYSGDNGPATNAALALPTGVYVDSTGNIFIADYNNKRIRFVSKNGGTYYGVPTTAGYIHTIAGNGISGYSGDGGPPTNAKLALPTGVYVDSTGNVFIADSNNNRIRFISNTGGTYYGVPTTAGRIYTIAGTGTAGSTGDGGAPTNASLYFPTGVYADSSGNVFISDNYNQLIRKIQLQ